MLSPFFVAPTGKYSGKVAPPGSRLTLKDYQFLVKSKFEGDDAWQVDAADAMMPIAAELGCSLAQLSIAWVLSNPKVRVYVVYCSAGLQLLRLKSMVCAATVAAAYTPSHTHTHTHTHTHAVAAAYTSIHAHVLIHSLAGLHVHPGRDVSGAARRQPGRAARGPVADAECTGAH